MHVSLKMDVNRANQVRILAIHTCIHTFIYTFLNLTDFWFRVPAVGWFSCNNPSMPQQSPPFSVINFNCSNCNWRNNSNYSRDKPRNPRPIAIKVKCDTAF